LWDNPHHAIKTNQVKKRKEYTMETRTKEQAIIIIKLHGNYDEINNFYKTCGNKEIYTLKSLKNWLGY